MNDTKDKVKFLESLKRHFDQLYSIDSTPATIINTAIPGLANSVKQMDSISRYYSRAGFLGLMFTKVFEPLYRKSKTLGFVPSKDSDQPDRPSCLTRVLAVHSLGSLGS